MVAIAHIKKYLSDHPEHFVGRENETLELAAKLADHSGMIFSGSVDKILGDHSKELFTLMSTSPDYLAISVESATSFSGFERGHKNEQRCPQCGHEEMGLHGGVFKCSQCGHSEPQIKLQPIGPIVNPERHFRIVEDLTCPICGQEMETSGPFPVCHNCGHSGQHA